MARRYDEDQAAEILAHASRNEVERVPASPGRGLTLREIQEIGLEVGIPAEDVSAAARTLEESGGSRSLLRSVRRESAMTRVVTLPSPPSQDQWDRIVVRLREVFGGPGSVEHSGALRSWSDEGVAVHGEPVEGGYRLRIDARDDSAVQAVGVGVSAVVVGLIMAAGLAVSGAGDAFTYGASGLVGLVGAISTAHGRLALSRWRARTARKLDEATEGLARSLRSQETLPPGSGSEG